MFHELLRLVEEFQKNPPTTEEMERARKSFANDAEKTLNNHESIGVELSEYIALGDWRLFFQGRDAAEKVTVDQVRDVAGRYYRRDNRIVGQFQPEDNPQRADIPSPPTAAEVLKDFKGKQATSVAEAFDPSQANIDKRTVRTTVGGVKLALLTKKNRGETVNLNLSLHIGDEKSLFGKRFVAQLAGAMLARGTSRYSREQLADEFDKLKVSGGVSGTGASIQTTREHLPAVLKLVAHVLKEPSFPESEFTQLKKQYLTSIESQKSDPAARGSERLSAHFNVYPKGDWRAATSLDESIAEIGKVTLDDVKAFHRDFYGATAAELAIVGDFDAQHPAHPARAGDPPVVAPRVSSSDTQGDRGGVAGQRVGEQMVHEIAARRQFQIQPSLRSFSSQRQFVAFDGQACVQIAVQIDVEFVRRQIELRAVAGEGV